MLLGTRIALGARKPPCLCLECRCRAYANSTIVPACRLSPSPVQGLPVWEEKTGLLREFFAHFQGASPQVEVVSIRSILSNGIQRGSTAGHERSTLLFLAGAGAELPHSDGKERCCCGTAP